MLLYLAIALVGTIFLVITALLGEVFDFFGDADADGDVHPLSGKIIAIGLTAFGATGMITQYYDWGPALSALTSAISALFLAAVAWWLLNAVNRQTASTDTVVSSLRGRIGEVTVTIPDGSVGEVLISSVSGTRQMIARSVDGSRIPAGTTVRVVETHGPVLLVERLEQRSATVRAPQRIEG